MVITSLLFAYILIPIRIITGFHFESFIRQSNPHQHRIPLSMVETDTSSRSISASEEQYKAIKADIVNMISSKEVTNEAQKQFIAIFTDFLEGYYESCLSAGEAPERFKQSVGTLLKAVTSKEPFKFQPFHKMVRDPYDYYSWGNNFMRPLIIKDKTRLLGIENFKEIQSLLAKGENVVILSNHQTEADAQVFSILLEDIGLSDLGEKSIFIAGHKVTNDPIAIPFSMGRNLICIHSKKHIKNPPEDFPRKNSENLQSMTAMSELMAAGGNLFWVAPSGGRDRPDPITKQFVVSPFDVKAIDMFKVLAIQSKKPLSFYPMSMYTNKLIPPPDTLSSSLGETRNAKRGGVSMHLLDRLPDMGGFKDKEWTAAVQSSVEKSYAELVKWSEQ